jgi:hypothetical protein
MALVPQDDALPLLKPTTRMIHPTIRQPTKTEHEACLDRQHPSKVGTHLLTLSPSSQSTILSLP